MKVNQSIMNKTFEILERTQEEFSGWGGTDEDFFPNDDGSNNLKAKKKQNEKKSKGKREENSKSMAKFQSDTLILGSVDKSKSGLENIQSK